MTHAISPVAHAQTQTTELTFDDVDADKTEVLIIGNRRDASHRLAAQQAHKETIRVCCLKALGIVYAGSLSFGSDPIDRHFDLGGSHRSDDEIASRVGRFAHVSSSARLTSTDLQIFS
jgi:hypothetical protein